MNKRRCREALDAAMNYGSKDYDHFGCKDKELDVASNAKLSGYKIGIVGCGYWGAKHARVAMSIPNVSSVVLIDPNENSVNSLVRSFPALRHCQSLEDACRHIDAVIIATPPQTHAAVAMQALRAGKHVLVEKPMATSRDDARRLIEEADRRRLVLMVGHTFEFNPAVRELRNCIRHGQLGQIYYLHSSRLNLGLYRDDVNVVWDLAPHDISIMNFVLESRPTMVSAWSAAHRGAKTDDLAYLKLFYGDLDVTGYVHVSWLDPRKVRAVTVVGDRKMAIYDDLSDERLRIYDRGVDFGEMIESSYERPISYRQGEIVSPHISPEEPLLIEDRHFVECISNGEHPTSSGQVGMEIISVLEAIDQSILEGRSVEVDYGEARFTDVVASANYQSAGQ